MLATLPKFRITPSRELSLTGSAVAGLTHVLPGDKKTLKLARHIYDLAFEGRIKGLNPSGFISDCSEAVRNRILHKRSKETFTDPVVLYKRKILGILKKLYLNEDRPKTSSDLESLRERLLLLKERVPEIKESLSKNMSFTFCQIKEGCFDEVIKKRISTPFYEFIDLIKELPSLGDVDSSEVIETFYTLFKDRSYDEFDVIDAGSILYECSQELTNPSVMNFIEELLEKNQSIDLRDVLTVSSFLKAAYEDSVKYNLKIRGGLVQSCRRKISSDLKWLNSSVRALSERVEIDPNMPDHISKRIELLDEINIKIKNILNQAREHMRC